MLLSWYEAPFILAGCTGSGWRCGYLVSHRPIRISRLYGGIPVHRGEIDRRLLETSLAVLRSGRPLVIAPEGGRSHTPGMRRALPGAAPNARVTPISSCSISPRCCLRSTGESMPTVPPKPLSPKVRPELTRLPPRTAWRRLVRRILKLLARLLVTLCTRAQLRGLENYPRQGPALVVINHLGDADAALGLAYFPAETDTLGKAELYDFPLLGKIMDIYGVIWVHRGRPDRKALRAALDGLKEGRIIALAPEGRESVTGALEDGTGGAAYLALKGRAPIIPVTFTGTENEHVYGSLKRLRRAAVTMTVGPAFALDELAGGREAIEQGTQVIMLALARQLPPEYQGVYQDILRYD